MHCADAAGLCNELSLIDCSPSPWRKKTSVSSRHTANEVHAGRTVFFFLTLVKAYSKFRSTVDAASRTGKLLHETKVLGSKSYSDIANSDSCHYQLEIVHMPFARVSNC